MISKDLAQGATKEAAGDAGEDDVVAAVGAGRAVFIEDAHIAIPEAHHRGVGCGAFLEGHHVRPGDASVAADGERQTRATSTVITKEEYDARSGGFDDYFEDDATVKGFTANGTFVMITEEDAVLADAAYRLYTAYLTYSALTPTKKQALESALTRIMEALSEEESEEPAATFGELLDAITPLSAFDATDGITIEERNVAKNALQTFESYLHGYLPSDY